MNFSISLVGLIFAGLAALLHVYIWTLESFTWTSARTRATFGTTAEEAAVTKPLAFNQGFYNLFLAIIAGVGIGLAAMDHPETGFALVLAGCGSMAAAALVLGLSDRTKLRAALTQGVLPLIATALVLVGIA